MKKILVLFILWSISLSAFAYQTYGIGKLVKIEGNTKHPYILIIKTDDKVGVLPIDHKDKNVKKLQDLNNKFVVFNGRILSKKVEIFEGKNTNEEVIALDSLREFQLKDLRLDDKQISRVEQTLENKNTPSLNKRARVQLDDGLTQSAIFTGGALLAHSAATSNMDSGDTRKDIGQMVILSSGLILMAKKVKDYYKLDWGDWHIPMHDNSRPTQSNHSKEQLKELQNQHNN